VGFFIKAIEFGLALTNFVRFFFFLEKVASGTGGKHFY
jgi:hypothetical protein